MLKPRYLYSKHLHDLHICHSHTCIGNTLKENLENIACIICFFTSLISDVNVINSLKAAMHKVTASLELHTFYQSSGLFFLFTVLYRRL